MLLYLEFVSLHRFFPHKFNTLERYEAEGGTGYRGPLPAAEFFAPEKMPKGTKKEFEAWYAEEEERMKAGAVYDLRQEMAEYCGKALPVTDGPGAERPVVEGAESV